MKENHKFLGVYAPPIWLSASDGQEEEDKSPVFFATSWEQLWGVISTPELPTGSGWGSPVACLFSPLSPAPPSPETILLGAHAQ